MNQYEFSAESVIARFFSFAMGKARHSETKRGKKKVRSILSAFLVAVPLAVAFSAPALAATYTDEAALQTALTDASTGSSVDITGTSLALTTTLIVPSGVTLTGNGTLSAAPSFSAPTITPTSPLVMGRTYNPMVQLDGTGSIGGSITINGAGAASVDGIYSDGSPGIAGVTVENIAPANSGSGFGSGIIITGDGSATIEGSKLTNIAKNGIDFASTGTLTTSGNTITGPGPNPDLAQNGIMVRGGTATLDNNTVSGMNNANTNQSACIATIGGNITGNGNSVSNCDIGVESDNTYLNDMGLTEQPNVNLTNTLSSNNGVPTSNDTTGEFVVSPRAAPVAAATPVPTVGESALAVLCMMLAALAAVKLRRRGGNGWW